MITQKANKRITKFLKNIGSTEGWVQTGFEKLDSTVGLMRRGDVWVIGAYNGTGKSYFVQNIIWRMLKNRNDEKISLFSTEMLEDECCIRFACMLGGFYPLQLEQYPKNYKKKFTDSWSELQGFDNFRIYNTMEFEKVKSLVEENKPRVVFLDYIQDMTINGKADEKETMPLLGHGVKQLALENDCTIVVVSQVNNYTQGRDYDEKSTRLLPFSNGKQLGNACSVGAVLMRKFNEDGEMQPKAELVIKKSRHGKTGIIEYKIKSGYILEEE